MKYKAFYSKIGANPFAAVGPKCQIPKGDLISITAEVPDDTPIAEVEKLAKQATKEGYEFTRVEPVD